MIITGDYEAAVRMMGDINFLSALVNFPKEAITDETVELLHPYWVRRFFLLQNQHLPLLSQASGNVAGLCNWAAAMCTYHAVAKEVEPKIVALRNAEARLAAAEADQTAAEGELAGVQAGLARAQADFEAAVSNKARLEEDAAATAARADAAESLLAALAGEEARWTAQAADFGIRKRCLAGDCLAAAAFTSYAGLFGRDARARLGAAVSGALADEAIPCSDGMTPTEFLVDDAEVAGWAAEVRVFWL